MLYKGCPAQKAMPSPSIHWIETVQSKWKLQLVWDHILLQRESPRNIRRNMSGVCIMLSWHGDISSACHTPPSLLSTIHKNHTNHDVDSNFMFKCPKKSLWKCGILADCPAMSFVFICWEINIRNTNQLTTFWGDRLSPAVATAGNK